METAVQEWMVRSMNNMAMKYEDWLRGCVHHDGRKGNVYLPCDSVLAIADWIEAHRDVAPVRHAKWEGCKGDITCSACGEYALYDSEDIEMQYRTLYCPFCGAKMDEGGSDGTDD